MNKKIRNLMAAKEKRKDDPKRFELERLMAEQYKKEYLLPRLRTASAKKYQKWLNGFLAKGGMPTHYYDYKWSLPLKILS